MAAELDAATKQNECLKWMATLIARDALLAAWFKAGRIFTSATPDSIRHDHIQTHSAKVCRGRELRELWPRTATMAIAGPLLTGGSTCSGAANSGVSSWAVVACTRGRSNSAQMRSPKGTHAKASKRHSHCGGGLLSREGATFREDVGCTSSKPDDGWLMRGLAARKSTPLLERLRVDVV